MQDIIVAAAVSAGVITLAEMGDKTQLLAMAFAARYKASKVLAGVFLATVFNHALAVALGTFVSRHEGLNVWIQIIASISFILFGLWTIRGDQLEGEENRVSRFGPVATVTIAFFLAEMGDKTQLTTIALAAKFPEVPASILIGTTTGMLIADSIGIIIGVVMCRKIPARAIKLVSAGIFILFGLLGTWESARTDLGLEFQTAALLVAVLAFATAVIAYRLTQPPAGIIEGEPDAEQARKAPDLS